MILSLVFFRKMDSSTSSEQLMERSFAEYSSIDSSLNESFSYQRSNDIFENPFSSAVNKLLKFQAEQNISNAATVRIAQIQNEMEGSQIEISLDMRKLIKNADRRYSFEYYVFCEKCKEVVKSGNYCPQCDIKTTKTRDNFFVYIPIKQQIALTLHKHLDAIMEFVEKERTNETIQDIYDGKVFQETKLKYPNIIILPLTFNLDGASVSNSSKTSIWPILIYQNFLPPNIRFMKENILLAGVISTNTKPDLAKLMLPFIIEMNQLFKDKISIIRDGKNHHFLPLVMFCLCDLPARAEVQQIKFVSGYHSCPVCLQRGEAVKTTNGKSSYVRYVKTDEKPEMRTHTQTITYTITHLATKKSVHGIKGITPLIAFPAYDVIRNVSTDQMHGTFLGIMNDLLDIWLGKKCLKNVKNGFKIKTVEDRMKFNRNILQLKPYSEITRKPRSLFERSFYKAVEYKNLLWFYIHYSLYGILSQAAINHFDLLSAATYILNKPEISKADIHQAADMLEKFANDFESNYSKNSVTMNVHMIRHYAHNVIESGPLWCQSMFGFESRMGDFKKCQRSNNCIAESIAKKYCLNDSKNGANKLRPNQTISMMREKKTTVSDSTAAIFKKFGLTDKHDLYNISYEIRLNNQLFKSINSPTTKSIDYFVRMRDKTIGSIELFVKSQQNFYVLIRKYEISYIKHHYNEIKLKLPMHRQLYDLNEISEKLIYLKFKNIEVVTTEPSKYNIV